MKRLLSEGRIVFGKDHFKQPERKYILRENMEENIPSVLPYGGSDDALLTRLSIPFDNPKPVGFAKELIKCFAGPDGTVMDFFAGSGTVGHACAELNAEKSISNRFVLVQLPQPVEGHKKFKTIFDIARTRVQLVSEQLKDKAHPQSADLGFRVFKLASSNIRSWEPDPADLENSLLKNAEHLVRGRKEEDVLYEILLKLGLDLCVPIEEKQIAGKSVHSIGGGALIACLSDGLTKEVIEPLASGIVAWRAALAPAVDTRVVFKDSGFADDIAKTNMAAILNQNGISDVRSL